MDRDPYADMFRFRLGDCVRWADYPHQPHWIGQRRWTQREMLEPVVEYRLRFSQKDTMWLAWVHDSDVTLWENADDEESHR